jgi:hypothetical protein
MMLKIRDPAALVAVLLIGLFAGRAEGAPQILGLVASNGMPTPLTCRDGLCVGELASFCLQEARQAPDSGQEYRLARGRGFTLIARLYQGRTLRLPARDLLAVKARLGFTNVDISLPEAKLSALGIDPRQVDSLAIEVAPETTILPVAAPGDPEPQSPDDIADAAGPLRHLAAETFDRPGEIPDAARLIGLLINTLPAEAARRSVALDALFRQVVAGIAPHRLGEEAIAEAETIAQSCRRSVETPSSSALSDCLELRHFTLMSILNGRFWAAAGS